MEKEKGSRKRGQIQFPEALFRKQRKGKQEIEPDPFSIVGESFRIWQGIGCIGEQKRQNSMGNADPRNRIQSNTGCCSIGSIYRVQ